MSKAIEVITSIERRRRWSAAEKEQLVAASLEAGASVSAVARQAGMHPSQLYGWRRQLVRQAQPTTSFAAVRIATEPTPAGGLIEIELASGSRVRISGPADAALVRAIMEVVAKPARRR